VLNYYYFILLHSFIFSSAAAENVTLQAGCMNAIMGAAGGDMRKAVTFLQTCHQLSDGNAVTLEDVVDISGQVCSTTTTTTTTTTTISTTISLYIINEYIFEIDVDSHGYNGRLVAQHEKRAFRRREGISGPTVKPGVPSNRHPEPTPR
jgi:hypothetical protein